MPFDTEWLSLMPRIRPQNSHNTFLSSTFKKWGAQNECNIFLFDIYIDFYKGSASFYGSEKG